MKVTVKTEKLEKSQVSMEVTVPEAELEQGVEKAVKKLAKQVNIPGFRAGKVPKAILENYVGEAVVMEEAAEQILPEAYVAGLDESGIDPVAQPEVQLVQLEKGKDFIFKAIITVKPEVILGEYKGISVVKEVISPNEEDVDAEIKKMQERTAKNIDLSEGDVLAAGDTAIIDFEGFVDDVAFEGGKAKNHSLVLGSNSFIPGFEEQLIGIKVGENTDVKVTFPEQYHSEDLAGKEAVFKVKVNSGRHKELPALDDEFVKDVTEDCDTVAELRAQTMEKLVKRSQEMANDMVKNSVLAKVIGNAAVEIPSAMIETRIDQMVDDFKEQLKYQGLDIERFFEFTKSDMNSLREQYKTKAEAGVKQDLVLEAVVAAEKIEPTQEDIDEQLKMIAQSYGQPFEKIKEAFEKEARQDYLLYSIKMMKAVDFLNDNAVIVEKEKAAKDAE
ncbi:MAG: trigger factor [Clostridia bacterium]|jgi:trigger factor|nr:trigger factor [Clostridia bacterium]